MKGLYAIVNVPDPHGHPVRDVTRAVLGARARGGPGAAVVQLRAKRASTGQRLEMLDAMVPLCRAAGSMLIVNDDVEAALAAPVGVAGVHVGQDDLGPGGVAELRARVAGRRGLVVGLSTHNLAQLRQAAVDPPDYAALGPIEETRSKADAEPVVGFEGLAEGCRWAAQPLVAIGGLDEERGVRAMQIGAAAVAMIAALQDASIDCMQDRAMSLAVALERANAPLPFEAVCAAIPILKPEHLAELARWSGDLSLQLDLGLPARFSPRFEGGVARYRPQDVQDLLFALDKRPSETWEEWSARTGLDPKPAAPLVALRRTRG